MKIIWILIIIALAYWIYRSNLLNNNSLSTKVSVIVPALLIALIYLLGGKNYALVSLGLTVAGSYLEQKI